MDLQFISNIKINNIKINKKIILNMQNMYGFSMFHFGTTISKKATLH